MQHSVPLVEFTEVRDERWLVTGALGCIGAWTVRRLLQDRAFVVALDAGDDRARHRLLAGEGDTSSVRFIREDITDLNAMVRVMDEGEITHVIHLAALQVPACSANPPVGAAVNIVGTLNVFEAAARCSSVRSIAYASSMAIYDMADANPRTLLVGPDTAANPRTHYGVFKQANESSARVYWESRGVPSVGVRPYVVFGPGRDVGLSAAPSLAVLAAVMQVPYVIPFTGRIQLNYAPDVAAAFVEAARQSSSGAHVLTLPGPIIDVDDYVASLVNVLPRAADLISVDGSPLPFPDGARPDPSFNRLGIGVTSLADSIRETAQILTTAHERDGLYDYARRVLDTPLGQGQTIAYASDVASA